jgi:MoaA/NifB/PqqE/SkfB family radical SAM enzyme
VKLHKQLAGVLGSKLLGRPFYAYCRVTRRCNLECMMCSVWKKANIEEEMTLPQIAEVADTLRRVRVPNVVITGGDPFLREDLPEIVRIFSDRGFSVRVQTNGGIHVTDEVFEEVVRAGVDDFTVSLDTLDRAKQDYICHGKGVWDGAVRTLRRAAERLPRAANVASCVVSRLNLHELPDIVRFTTSLGVYCTLVPVVLARKAADPDLFRAYCDEFSFAGIDPVEVDRIYDELLELKERGYRMMVSTRFLNESRQWVKTEDVRWNCHAGELYFEVFTDGSVGICNDVAGAGSIIGGTFGDDFHTDAYRRKARSLRSSCPGCTYACYREPSYMMHDWSVLFEGARAALRFRRGDHREAPAT